MAGRNPDDLRDQRRLNGFDFDTSPDLEDAHTVFDVDRKIGDPGDRA